MSEQATTPHWWQTMPAILTAIAAVITALGGLLAVWNNAGESEARRAAAQAEQRASEAQQRLATAKAEEETRARAAREELDRLKQQRDEAEAARVKAQGEAWRSVLPVPETDAPSRPRFRLSDFLKPIPAPEPAPQASFTTVCRISTPPSFECPAPSMAIYSKCVCPGDILQRTGTVSFN